MKDLDAGIALRGNQVKGVAMAPMLLKDFYHTVIVSSPLPGMEGTRWRSEVTSGLHERCTATLGCDLVR